MCVFGHEVVLPGRVQAMTAEKDEQCVTAPSSPEESTDLAVDEIGPELSVAPREAHLEATVPEYRSQATHVCAHEGKGRNAGALIIAGPDQQRRVSAHVAL
ncbi:hypothetical protein GCM10010365_03410 [Streptomyces poonensis]|uniref:Uncharacterized protein n=1 Tax=Streptomyces poonensis TaxID=68255 RepID=A0A918P7U8_9ACTN|nr:hypothetical protein GCM10010365_03410 [Streptomyces poonensis]GLJ92399.1 hypothetical protein GCM10017589_50080 [Streptomyces poonensis]